MDTSLCGISGQLLIYEGLGSSASISRGSVSVTWRKSAFWPLNLPCVDMSLVGHRCARSCGLEAGGTLLVALTQLEVLGLPPPAPASVSPEPVSQVERCPHPVQPEARLPLGNKPIPAVRGSNRARRACWWNKPFLYIFHIVYHFKVIGAHEWKGPNVLRLSLC